MGQPKDCPNCGLVNPPQSQKCDCGWDFSWRRDLSYARPAALGTLLVIFVVVFVRVVLPLLFSGGRP